MTDADHQPRRAADGYCACDGCVKQIWDAYRLACRKLTDAETRLVAVRKVAAELTKQSAWLPDGRQASDYGHDVLTAAGEPQFAHV